MSEHTPSENELPEYTAEKLAENWPSRVDPALLSGPYTPASLAHAAIERLTRRAEGAEALYDYRVNLTRIKNAEIVSLREALRKAHALADRVIKRNQGGYVGDKDDVREIRSLIAAALGDKRLRDYIADPGRRYARVEAQMAIAEIERLTRELEMETQAFENAIRNRDAASAECERLRAALTAEREGAREKVRALDKVLDACLPHETFGEPR